MNDQVSFRVLYRTVPLDNRHDHRFYRRFLTYVLYQTRNDKLSTIWLSLHAHKISRLIRGIQMRELPVLRLPFLERRGLVLTSKRVNKVARRQFSKACPAIIHCRPVRKFGNGLLILLCLKRQMFLFRFLPGL